MLEHYPGLSEILDTIDRLSKYEVEKGLAEERLERRYKIRAALVPLWKNYISMHVDKFNRYKEMADHGTIHISNMINLAADLLLPLYEGKNLKEDFHKLPLNAEELFILIGGIFLHDVGMADIKTKNAHDLHSIRERHGLLSYEFLMSYHQQGDPANLFPTLDEEEKKLIALMALHHHNRAVIHETDGRILKEKGGKPFEDIPSLNDRYPQGVTFNGVKVNIVIIPAILRFLDSFDTQYSRAGSIWLSRVQLDNNRRLIEETEAQIANLRELSVMPESIEILNKILEEKRTFINYLKHQKEHYLKHLSIEKTWFLDNRIVYKLLSHDLVKEIKDFARHDFEPENFYIMSANEVKYHYYYMRDYLESHNLNIHLDFDYKEQAYNPLLDKAIEIFDEDKHLPSILARPHYKKFLTNTIPEAQRNNYREEFISELVSKSDETHPVRLIIGPAGSGKTEAAAQMIKTIKKDYNVKEHRIFAFSFTKNTDIEEFIVLLTKFIAASGNYYYYNKILMEVEIVESQWKALFDCLNREGFFFIFDNMHELPLADHKTLEYNFMKSFFENVRKPDFFIFSRKIPYIMRQEVTHPDRFRALPMKIMAIPPLKGEKIKDIIKKEVNIPENFHGKIKKIIKRFNNFPWIIQVLKERLNNIKERFINPEDMIASLKLWEIEFRNTLCARVFNTGSIQEVNLLFNLRLLPVSMEKDKKNRILTEKIRNITEEKLKNLFQELQSRKYLTEDEEPAEWINSLLFPPALDNIANILKEDLILDNTGDKAIWVKDINREEYILRIIPPLKNLKNLYQGGYHHLDAWEHTLTVCATVKNILERPEDFLPEEVIKEYKSFLQVPLRQKLLLLTALFHDSGKPFTVTEEKGSVKFTGHETKGEEIVRTILPGFMNWNEEVNLPDIEFISSLTGMHKRFLDLLHIPEVTDSALKRLVNQASYNLPELMVLSLADLMSSKGEKSQTEGIDKLKNLFVRAVRIDVSEINEQKFKPLLTGNDLKIMGYKEGPVMGKILKNLKEEKEKGNLHTRDDEIEWVKRNFTE